MSPAESSPAAKDSSRKPAPISAGGFEIVVTGGWLKTAGIRSEGYIQGDPAEAPGQIIADLKSKGVRADVFTFTQRVPDVKPRHAYPMRWDNVAALPILGYSEWWEKRLNQDTRRCVRLASKRGLDVRPVKFDDAFCEGIRQIYNETPIRQGRKFWHYGKDLETVKRENASFVEESEFLGAYLGEELVGFLKMVYVGNTANIMQIISKMSHYDKKPMNALMAKAVEICNERKVTHLFYRKYVYHKGLPDSLTEFKRRNGFEQVDIPRYFVPLTLKGRIAVALGLQTGVTDLLPAKVVAAGKSLRSRLNRGRDQ